MCVTKKKQRNQHSVRVFEPFGSTTVPVATPGQTPAGTSRTQSNENSKLKKKTPGNRNGRSEAEKKSEDQEKTAGVLKMTNMATAMGPPPPVNPPIKRDAKREVNGEKDAKDPDYVTLNDVMPRFESAKLKGYHCSKEKTLRIEPTQQGSGEDKNKKSGEISNNAADKKE